MDIGALNRPIFSKLHRDISVTLILSIDQAEVEENCASCFGSPLRQIFLVRTSNLY